MNRLAGGLPAADLLPRERIAAAGLAAGVGFVPGAAFAVCADQAHAARCCYASVDEATLTEAVRRLASCVA